MNLCDYCARLAAVETSEVLALDAVQNSAPAVWSVLTTRTATLDVSAFQVARRAVSRAVRDRWPDAECATLVEFTSGYAKRSGGERRPHWNDMWKGVALGDQEELHERMAWAWCNRVDAQPYAQYAGAIEETGGLMRYLALHFQKEEQAPPAGWRGHRFRTTRGYLDRPMAQAREEARRSLRFRRELWKAAQLGLEGQEALEAAQNALSDQDSIDWELVRLSPIPTTFDADGFPSAWEEIACPVRA